MKPLLPALLLMMMTACGHRTTLQPPPETPQLWCLMHSQVMDQGSLQTTLEQIERLHAAGYTGIAFWDVSFVYLTSAAWPDPEGRFLRKAMEHATAIGMKTLTLGPPFGYSNDLLSFNPNWAEGFHVSGTRFQVDASGRKLLQRNSFSGLRNGGFEEDPADWHMNDRGVETDPAVSHSGFASGTIRNPPGNARFSQKLDVTPWRQYHVRLFVKASNYAGPPVTVEAFDSASQKKIRFYQQTQISGSRDWTRLDAVFNSQDSTSVWLYFGVWGRARGTLWLDDVSVEETGLTGLIRRQGAPLRLYDPATGAALQEGKDFDEIHDPGLTSNPQDDYHTPPVITVPAGSSLRPGQMVAADYYAAQPVDSINRRLGVCLTDPAVAEWLENNARKILSIIPPDTGIFLQYDEMRQMNSCKSCRDKNMTAGQLLAWHTRESMERYRRLQPGQQRAFYVWNDMFDPYANAVDNYYFVEGTLAGSVEGLPAEVIIMNWNLEHPRESLQWFAGGDRRQPVAHRQIIAGYYDTHNGAAAATRELQDAQGIPGIDGLMYTTWENDYTQLESFAEAARQGWRGYRSSVIR